MIFCVRQLVGKAIEHNTKMFLLLLTYARPMILYPAETNIMVGHQTKSEQKHQMSDHK